MKKLLLFLALVTFSAQAQISESFEGGTTVPAGWTVISGGDTNTWVGTDLATSTTIQAEHGTKVFSILYGATAHNDYLVTPQFDVIPGTTNLLSFWARSRDAAYPEMIDVVLSTTSATAGAFTVTLLPNVAPESGTDFYKYTVDLSAYAGQPVYVGFHSTTTDMFAFDIDNVVIGGTPTCLEGETTAVITNATASTATITWEAPLVEPSAGYDIYYSLDNMAPTSATSPTVSVGPGVLTVNVTGLVASSKYYLYIRSNCGGGNTSVWGPLTVFNSFVDPVALPYASGLDNATELAGWTTSGNNTGSMGLGTTAANSQSPSQYWIFNTSVTPTPANNNWLYSRPISLSAGEVVTVSFWYRSSAVRNLRLTVGTANNAAAQTTVLYNNATLPTATTYAQITAPTFTAPAAGTYFFAFNDLSASTAVANTLRIDTISLTSILGTSDLLSSKFSVYPNPVSNVVNFSNDANAVVSLVEIADLNGRIVKSVKANATEGQISVSDLATGMYLMNITTDQGVATKKIVKQ
jgi:hypothetical protein